MKYLIALLAVAGIVVSSMALHVHLMDRNAAPPCAVTEHWDCGTVGHSRFSWLLPKTSDEMIGAQTGTPHVPVAALGIVAYTLIAILALMGRRWLVFELAQVGFFFAAFLSYIEAYVMEIWCIYCVWSQAIIAAIFLLSAVALLLNCKKRRCACACGTAPAVPVHQASVE